MRETPARFRVVALEEKVGMVPTLVLKTSSRKAGFESYFFRNVWLQ